MCPFCWLSLGVIVARAASVGGVTALAVKVSRKKKDPRAVIQKAK